MPALLSSVSATYPGELFWKHVMYSVPPSPLLKSQLSCHLFFSQCWIQWVHAQPDNLWWISHLRKYTSTCSTDIIEGHPPCYWRGGGSSVLLSVVTAVLALLYELVADPMQSSLIVCIWCPLQQKISILFIQLVKNLPHLLTYLKYLLFLNMLRGRSE